jgi:hypothetical protein
MSDRACRQRLKAVLESLPEKEQKKDLVGNLRQFGQNAAQARDYLERSFQAARLVRDVFPGAEFRQLEEKTADAARTARACGKKLVADVRVVSKDSFDKQIVAIKEYATAGANSVSDAWQKRLNAHLDTYQRIAEAARLARVPGSEPLEGTLSELRTRQRALPSDSTDAAKLARNVAGLAETIQKLGLTGKTRDFLVAAANGQASARDLEQADIREWLTRYQLWDILRVRLGPGQ